MRLNQMRLNQKKFLTSLQIKLHKLSDKSPEFVVTLNGDTQVAVEQSNDITTFVMYSLFGNNQLVINFLNKDCNDTVVDANGNITNDLAVEFKTITIENVDITHEIKNISCYVPYGETQPQSTYGYMHKNGQLTVDYQCPIFYFLRNCNLLVDNA